MIHENYTMDIETTWYEFSPYIYALVGLATIAATDSRLSVCSGALLLVAAATILRLRWVHRRKLDQKVEKAL